MVPRLFLYSFCIYSLEVLSAITWKYKVYFQSMKTWKKAKHPEQKDFVCKSLILQGVKSIWCSCKIRKRKCKRGLRYLASAPRRVGVLVLPILVWSILTSPHEPTPCSFLQTALTNFVLMLIHCFLYVSSCVFTPFPPAGRQWCGSILLL